MGLSVAAAAMGPRDQTDVEALFEAANRQVGRERERTAAELAALESFESELRDIQPKRETDPTPTAGSAGVAVVSTGRSTREGVRAVRDAYESTVMAVPHYAEEYDDTYVESLAGEFGPDVATALTRAAFDDRCKRATLSAAAESQAQRERFLGVLEAEREALASTRTALTDVLEELGTYRERTLADEPFETLDAYHARLAVLADHCEELAAARQSTLGDRRRTLWLPVDGPDFARYVYRPLDADYPALSAVAAAAERVTDTRAAVERAIGYCH